jgi:arginyl-tRNA synthetase
MPEAGVPDFNVSHPKDEAHGDYATNLALLLAKKLGKNPREVAEKLITSLHNDTFLATLIDTTKIEVAGAGFINFTLKTEYLLGEMRRAQDENYGRSHKGKDKLAIVEYSSPNIAKPFTIGHLRSTVIGDAVANLLELNGWEVLRDNHLGDWGTQFGKQICAIKHWGNIEDIEKSENPVKELVALYVRFHEEAEKEPLLEEEAREWFKKLEQGDKEARKLWQQCIDWSYAEFRKIYDLLGIQHSDEFNAGRGLGESFFEDKMSTVVAELRKRNLLVQGKEGAQLVFFPNDKYSPAMILKKDGSSLYHTRDLATDKYRLDNYHPDLVINEVGAEQELYFKQLFEMEYMLNWYNPGQRVHVMHGMYRFKEGKMSTRKGNVIWLEEVLEEAVGRAWDLQKIISKPDESGYYIDSKSLKYSIGARKNIVGFGKRLELAEMVGVGALKWNDLKGEAKRDIIFDWDDVLNMKGNSGPFVQYSYARASSILKKFKIDSEPSKTRKPSNFEDSELALMRWLYRYPEVIEEAGRTLSPHMIAGYVYELSARFNSFYQSCRVEEDGVVNTLRYELTEAVANVLKSGLSALGIAAPEEM